MKLSLGSLLIFILLHSSISFGQTRSLAPVPTVRSQVAKILLSTLGGAVLGISTLSFYERPQDHLSNVAVGATMGALIGSVYVTRESLNYDSAATADELSQFQFAMIPSRDLYQLQWQLKF